MPTPEQKAREKIDDLLTQAGWIVQDRDKLNRNAGLGVAAREFQLMGGACDYLLFIDGKAAGVLEAKPEGTTLSGVSDQSLFYVKNVPDHIAKWGGFLYYHYESTGTETLFCNLRDQKPRSRRVFSFHRPETLLEWIKPMGNQRGQPFILMNYL